METRDPPGGGSIPGVSGLLVLSLRLFIRWIFTSSGKFPHSAAAVGLARSHNSGGGLCEAGACGGGIISGGDASAEIAEFAAVTEELKESEVVVVV